MKKKKKYRRLKKLIAFIVIIIVLIFGIAEVQKHFKTEETQIAGEGEVEEVIPDDITISMAVVRRHYVS